MMKIEPRAALVVLDSLLSSASASSAPLKIAMIGSRHLTDAELQLCTEIGRTVANLGRGRVFVGSGNAQGADQAYARGVNEVDPKLLVLYLPWESYEAGAVVQGNRLRCPPYPPHHTEAAERIHARWDALQRGARALHVRNMAITESAQLCFAWPNATKWGGGTGTGMRRATELEIPVLNLRSIEARMGVGDILRIPPHLVEATLPEQRSILP